MKFIQLKLLTFVSGKQSLARKLCRCLCLPAKVLIFVTVITSCASVTPDRPSDVFFKNMVADALAFEVEGRVDDYMALWSPEGEQVFQGGEVVKGKQKIREGLQGFVDTFQVKPMKDKDQWCRDVIMGEDMVTVRCRVALKLINRAEGELESAPVLKGTVIYVIKKEGAQWRFIQEMTLFD